MSTLAIPQGLEPLAVWDVHDGDYPYGWTGRECRQAAWWILKNLDAFAHNIHRVEFYLLDGPFAIVHKYALQGDGRKYQDPDTGEAAILKPVIVPLAELPPAHLLR